MSDKPTPPGYHTITPYLVVKNAQGQIDFLTKAFGGTIVELLKTSQGTIMHAEVRLGDSVVMIGQAREPFQSMPTVLYYHVANADESTARALAAGAKSLKDPQDQFYGHRTAAVTDLNGNQWWLAQVLEVLSADEIRKRAAAFDKKQQAESDD